MWNLDLLPQFRVVGTGGEPDPSCDPLGTYAETYWLPVLSPCAYLVGRRLVTLWRRHPPSERLMLVAKTIAFALGIGERQLLACLRQLEAAGLVRQRGGAVVEICDRWPRTPPSEMARMPAEMQHAEPDHWAAETPAPAGLTL